MSEWIWWEELPDKYVVTHLDKYSDKYVATHSDKYSDKYVATHSDKYSDKHVATHSAPLVSLTQIANAICNSRCHFERQSMPFVRNMYTVQRM